MNVARLATWAALAAFVVIGGLFFREARQGRVVRTQLAVTTAARDKLQVQLTQATARSQTQDQQLRDLDAALGATKTRLSATEAHNVQLARKAAGLQERLQERETRIATLETQLAAVTQDLAQARASAGSPELVARHEATIAELREQLANARRAPVAPPPATPVPVLTTNRARNAAVVSIGPGNAFVVLNYGARHGALPRQTLTVSRGTQTLATVLISDVRENYSIAQVQPDSLRGALHKGDSAVLNSITP